MATWLEFYRANAGRSFVCQSRENRKKTGICRRINIKLSWTGIICYYLYVSYLEVKS